MQQIIVDRYLAGDSAERIAADLGISPTTVFQHLKKAGVPRRSLKEAWALRQKASTPRQWSTFDPKEIKRLYVEEHWAIKRISTYAKMGVQTVRQHLTKQGVSIQRAARNQAVFPTDVELRQRFQLARVPQRPPLGPGGRPPKTCSPQANFQDVVDGLLLGDGGLSMHGVHRTPTFSMSQSPAQEGWLDDIQRELELHGVIVRRCVLPPQRGGRGEARQLRTLAYNEFHPYYKRWYSVGSKKQLVPRDLQLTPQALALWYLGDGTVTEGRVKFCTHSFSHESVQFLRDQLERRFGWRARVGADGRHPVVWLRWQADMEALWQLVAPYTPECLRYKLTVEGRRTTTTTTPA